ncbi:MAG: methionyl-tRNA formyltransferase [Desulfobacterales bacterium]|nr:methionyl-tRNA formyltransferase [Desulfobacterales bacterium]
MTYIIVSNRRWNNDLATKLAEKTGYSCQKISCKEDLNYKKLIAFDPKFIFFPHWSYIIPDEIFQNFECVIFHMTDLPYGRGGSPLQNLIVRGHEKTVITALKCVKGVDAGPVYLKKTLSLIGSAEEIYIRANSIIEEMICEITQNNMQAVEQEGKITEFKRRTPEQGDWSKMKNLDEVYDYIRMLDAEGYPPAFVKVGPFKLEFTRASRRFGSIISDVCIRMED